MVRYFLALLICLNAFAMDPWSPKDKAAEIVFDGLVVADWGQTLYIRDKGPDIRGCKEENPILGMHPTRQSVNEYMLTAIAVHALVTKLLPERFRPYWQMVSIGVEAGQVERNYQLGIKFNY